MQYPVSFIHIGLPKCASTYLQSVWAMDEAYTSLNMNQAVDIIRKYTLDESGGAFPSMDGGLPDFGNTTAVASSEGFSWAYMNAPEQQKLLKRYHGIVARVLGETNMSDTILIVIRNPVDLMRALHEQSIKEGGFSRFSDFYIDQIEMVKSTLNLKYIIAEYRKYFAKVVLLSSDELRDDPERFWNKYHCHLNAPVPDASSFQTAKEQAFSNKSLGDSIIYLATMNRYSKTLLNRFSGLKNLPDVLGNEYAALNKSLSSNWVWWNRRIAEYASKDELEDMCSLLVPLSDQESFRKVEVDSDTKSFVAENYLDVIAEAGTIDGELVDYYQESLEAVVK